MEIKIVDTTLRDGEQKPGVELGMKDKIEIIKLIDKTSIYQIEAGIPAMGGDEKKTIERIMELNLKSKIFTWNRMNIGDIQHSIDCKVDIIHISVPTSEIQIKSKLGKDKTWVIESMRSSIYFAKNKGFELVVGFEDASRTDTNFLIELAALAKKEGVNRIRYADTVGILYPERIYTEVKKIKAAVDIEVGIHAHNDFGMALANSMAAVKGGAACVDCTFGGIGERAGNCDYFKFLKLCESMKLIKEGNLIEDENLVSIIKEIQDRMKME